MSRIRDLCEVCTVAGLRLFLRAWPPTRREGHPFQAVALPLLTVPRQRRSGLHLLRSFRRPCTFTASSQGCPFGLAMPPLSPVSVLPLVSSVTTRLFSIILLGAALARHHQSRPEAGPLLVSDLTSSLAHDALQGRRSSRAASSVPLELTPWLAPTTAAGPPRELWSSFRTCATLAGPNSENQLVFFRFQDQEHPLLAEN